MDIDVDGEYLISTEFWVKTIKQQQKIYVSKLVINAPPPLPLQQMCQVWVGHNLG